MDRNDQRWGPLRGGYRVPYDPWPALDRLAAGDPSVWTELWQELYHQGDVGEASYAAVPELVRLHQSGDWNTFGLAATIEEARSAPDNPPIPSWLQDDYDQAWRRLFALAVSELQEARGDELVAGVFAVLALRKGKVTLARLAMLTEDERAEMLEQVGFG